MKEPPFPCRYAQIRQHMTTRRASVRTGALALLAGSSGLDLLGPGVTQATMRRASVDYNDRDRAAGRLPLAEKKCSGSARLKCSRRRRLGSADLKVRMHLMFSLLRCLSLLLLSGVAAKMFAWHRPPHQQITRAALDSLPVPLQEKLGLEKDMIIWVNCMYPDRYRGLAQQGPEQDPNPGPRDRSEMKVYCEMPDGRPIHNVTHNRAEDLASLEHLLRSIIAEMRRNHVTAAARYMGTLAHLIEDSCSPAHAGPLPLAVAELRQRQTLPNPPPWFGRLDEHGSGLTAGNLHAAIELTLLPFNLRGRSPERIGNSVAEVAPKLLDRCYAIVEENRADLVEMVRATYANDITVMERLRSRAARKAAELLADAFYAALTLADEGP